MNLSILYLFIFINLFIFIFFKFDYISVVLLHTLKSNLVYFYLNLEQSNFSILKFVR